MSPARPWLSAALLALLALLAPLAGCYKTPESACAFRCGAEGDCPPTYFCLEDNQCHRLVNGELATCDPLPSPPDAAPEPDAAEPPPPDAAEPPPPDAAEPEVDAAP